MANAQKYNRAAVGHLGKHYERGVNENRELVKFGNQDINPELSHLNYNLAPNRNSSQVDFINQRISEVHCLNRKDVNVMCSWVVTFPKNLSQDKEREFFEQTYEFLKNRYGGEQNVISSYVHKDEKQPHMHFAFIPVIFDNKKNIEKVSAKEVVNRKDLQTFHKDLSKNLELYFGYDVGILNDATKEGNKSIQELKQKTAIERIAEIREQRKQVQDMLIEVMQKKSSVDMLVDRKESLNKQINYLKSYLSNLEDINLSFKEIDEISGKKSLLNNNVNLEIEDLEKLKELSKKSLLLEKKIKEYEVENETLYDSVCKYKAHINSEKSIEKKLKDIEKEKKIEELEKYKNYIKKTGQESKFKEFLLLLERETSRNIDKERFEK